MPKLPLHSIVILLACLLAPHAYAQQFDERFEHWPVNLRSRGTIVFGSQLQDVAVLNDAIPRSAPRKRFVALLDKQADAATAEQYASLFDSESTATTVQRMSDDLTDQLPKLLQESDIFCWHITRPLTETERRSLATVRSDFEKHLAGRGTIIALGQAAPPLGTRYRTKSGEPATACTGLNLVPDCVIETDSSDLPEQRDNLLRFVGSDQTSVGIAIEKNTVAVLAGRKIYTVGEGKANFVLADPAGQLLRNQQIVPGGRRTRSSNNQLLDLTQWRRVAIDHTLPPFPSAQPQTPHVAKGSLVIVGGGGMPRGLMTRFVELAGGVEHARLVYVPCSESDEVSTQQSTVAAWKRMGVQHATYIHTKDRNKANGDEQFLAPLKDATGIWFGGGRQWNLADSYYGTKAHALMKAVVRRGGVAGGSSAGASIQARYLARATPIGNTRIMAPGYERGGLGFISGVAIDQHFSQRGRQKDMTQLVDRYPQMLGIGIDEATAIIVHESVAEVVGRGKVFFYDRQQKVQKGKPDYTALPAGSTYDLAIRAVLTDSRDNTPSDNNTSPDSDWP